MNLGMMFIFLKKYIRYFLTCSTEKPRSNENQEIMNTPGAQAVVFLKKIFSIKSNQDSLKKKTKKTADSRSGRGSRQDEFGTYCCA